MSLLTRDEYVERTLARGEYFEGEGDTAMAEVLLRHATTVAEMPEEDWQRWGRAGQRLTRWLYMSPEERAWAVNTRWGAHCSCGEWLETEADFAQHFTISNPRYLNLGECPNQRRAR